MAERAGDKDAEKAKKICVRISGTGSLINEDKKHDCRAHPQFYAIRDKSSKRFSFIRGGKKSRQEESLINAKGLGDLAGLAHVNVLASLSNRS